MIVESTGTITTALAANTTSVPNNLANNLLARRLVQMVAWREK